MARPKTSAAPSAPRVAVLEELHIRGLGVIDDAIARFGPGLSVVTGETGAGKTMVVTGLQLLFGGRATSARVRTGAEQAEVDGRVVVADGSPAADRVRDAGGELDDDGTLLLRRTVSAAGRSRAHAGGTATPIGVLADVGADLLVVHGQADQMRLSSPTEHRRALDRYAGVDLSAYREAYERWLAAERRLDERRRDAAALEREADLLAHGLREIEAVDPQPGEDEETAARAARLGHADALRLSATAAHHAMVGDPDDLVSDAATVSSLLGAARRELEQAAADDPELDGLRERLVDLGAVAGELGSDLAAYVAGLDADPAELDRIESRRAELARVVRRYGRPEAEDEPGREADVGLVLRWAERARGRLADLDTSDEALAELAAERDAARAEATARARELSQARRTAAASLATAATTELHGLAMSGAELTVSVTDRGPLAGQAELDGAAAGPDGIDEVEFLLRPAPDVPPFPVQRGASGGELSRVMLALEVVLAGTDPVPVMVFDEVDAGVGGRAAVEIGRRLARLAREHQVVVVTHLAQVAAFADTHLVVGPAGSTGVSAVDLVEGDARVTELARMLAGTGTEKARGHARELLADARADSRADSRADVAASPPAARTRPARGRRAAASAASRT